MIGRPRPTTSQHRVRWKDIPSTDDRQRPSDTRDRGLAAAEQWIGQHPAVSLGLALIAGVSLGWLIKRR